MESIHGFRKPWSSLPGICLVVVSFSIGSLCALEECEIDFHMQSSSLMLLEGGNASVLCDARCFAGDEPVEVLWRDERGRGIKEFPSSVFAVRYNRGLLNRMMILGANSDIAGSYVCSVMRSGNLLQQRGVRVVVLGNTGTSYRFPTDTGPRRGDQTPRRDLEHRPVRSAKYRLQKRDASNSVFGHEFQAYQNHLDKLPSAKGLQGLDVDPKKKQPGSHEGFSSSSVDLLTRFDDQLKNKDDIIFRDEVKAAVKPRYGVDETIWKERERTAGVSGDLPETDIDHSTLRRKLNDNPMEDKDTPESNEDGESHFDDGMLSVDDQDIRVDNKANHDHLSAENKRNNDNGNADSTDSTRNFGHLHGSLDEPFDSKNMPGLMERMDSTFSDEEMDEYSDDTSFSPMNDGMNSEDYYNNLDDTNPFIKALINRINVADDIDKNAFVQRLVGYADDRNHHSEIGEAESMLNKGPVNDFQDHTGDTDWNNGLPQSNSFYDEPGNWDAPLYGESWARSPGFGGQENKEIEREHEIMEISHIRAKRDADQDTTTTGKMTTTPSKTTTSSSGISATADRLASTAAQDDPSSTSTILPASSQDSIDPSEAPSTTTSSTQPSTVITAQISSETTTTRRFTTTTKKISSTPSAGSSGSENQSGTDNTESGTSSKTSGSNRDGSENKEDNEDNKESSNTSGQSSQCPEAASNFGKYGVLALAVSLAVSFLLFYAILMIVFMPRILARRRADRDKSDHEKAIFKKKTSLGEEIAPLTLISDDSPASDIEADQGKDTSVDLDKSASSESDKVVDSKKEADSKETTAAVSTFLLRQSSQTKKDEEGTKKDEKDTKKDEKDESKSDGKTETSDKKTPDSVPSTKDQSETPNTTAAPSDKKEESSSSQSQKPIPPTEGQSEKNQSDDLMSVLTLFPNQTTADKDKLQGSNGTQGKADSSNKNQSESVSEKDKPKGDAPGEDLPPPPPSVTDQVGDNVIDV